MIWQLHLKGNQPALSVFEAISLMLMFGSLIVAIMKHHDR
ncbi:putative holin-like toxin [Xylocopilactobacillus apicola]|nr:putative holin-like toxin [Xylocopilactobacillus apicola]